MDSPKQSQICVNGRTVDLRRGSVMDGSGQVLTLRPQAAQVLRLLAAQPGVPVSRDELMEAVWPGIAVTDDSLVQCVKEVRKALGDDRHQLIVTLVKRGYVLEESALHQPESKNADAVAAPAATATPRGDAQAAERSLSIAVLPFANLSADPEQEFFADGLTEDLITELSKVPDLFVIARHSTFAYKAKPMDVRQAAHDLGVRYLVEGSARRAAERVRISAQLIDAVSGNTLWAERFDRTLEDIFAVQDEVTGRIAEALVGRLTKAPLRNRPGNIEAYQLCVRARGLSLQTADAAREACFLLEHAISLDPNYAEAHRWLALNLWFGWAFWNEAREPNRARAMAEARGAVALDPGDAGNRWVLGIILGHEGRWADSDAEFEATFKLDPNHADAWAMRSDLLTMNGRATEAIDHVRRALRLNPHPPGWYYWMLGQAEFVLRDYASAVQTLRRPETYRTTSRRTLAASLAQLGRLEDARQEGQLFMLSNPHFSVQHWADSQPLRDHETRQLFIDGYRKAGLPD